MRPTGALHLGHYHGVLKNWVRLQSEYECLFFVADWHALTTHYDEPQIISEHVWGMLIDWLAAGVDPAQATLFIQSRVPEHAELHLLFQKQRYTMRVCHQNPETRIEWHSRSVCTSQKNQYLRRYSIGTFAECLKMCGCTA